MRGLGHMTGREHRTIVPVAALLALAGCSQAPAGQVAAHVNGQEVSDRAVEAELASANIAPDAKGAMQGGLDKVITRDLIVEQARREGLDKSPDYLAFRERADDLVLADMLVRRWMAAVPPPAQPDIDRYIAANPFRFDRRVLFQVDQIEARGGAVAPRDLAPLHSMDAVAALLDQHHVEYRRMTQVLDSALIAPEMARQLSSAPAGEPVAEPVAGGLQLIALQRSDPAPVSPDLGQRLAADALRQAAIAQRITALRAGARIEYRADLRPAAKPAAAAPS
jgi:peptidyl-prolyl cis-trans isomerase C